MPLQLTRLSVLLFALLLVRSVAAAECPSGMAGGGGGPPPSDLSPPPISPTMAPEAMTASLDKYLAELTMKAPSTMNSQMSCCRTWKAPRISMATTKTTVRP